MKNRALRRVLSLSLLAALIAASLFMNAASAQPPTPSERPFAPGRVLVKFESGISPAARANLHRALGGRPMGTIPGIDVEVVSVATRAEEARAAAYARSPLVAYVEPDYIAKALGDPDDDSFAIQWGLDNDGQVYNGDSGKVDADIDAPEAWDITTGSTEVLIAILDSGIDQNHVDLDGKLVDNVDFTGSGSIDDFYGHGTHVAGIAAAETNNGEGVAGVSHNARLLNVKVLNDLGWGYNSWIANGIRWAADYGAQVINMSLGGYRKSRTLESAVDYAWGKGAVLAAAAGNDGTTRKLYPAAYSNCIAVAATDDDDQRVDEPGWWASNYGDWVDVAAPGLYVYSTFPNHPYAIGKSLDYDYGSGTSMSTPFVSGLAALVWATEYGDSNSAVRGRIETTADPIPGTGTYWIHGRINACNAVGGNCSYGDVDQPPTVSITSPADGSAFGSEASILFEGTASDVEDGDLTDSLSWTSCIDGGIGTGGNISAILSDGSHTLTASVIDSGGNTGSASIGITVGAPPIEPTTLTVSAITYSTEGGRDGKKHLNVTVAVVDDLGDPASGASVSIDLRLGESSYASWVGTTGADGTVAFRLNNAPSGCYTTVVNDVTANGLAWDGVTPVNGFCK